MKCEKIYSDRRSEKRTEHQMRKNIKYKCKYWIFRVLCVFLCVCIIYFCYCRKIWHQKWGKIIQLWAESPKNARYLHFDAYLGVPTKNKSNTRTAKYVQMNFLIKKEFFIAALGRENPLRAVFVLFLVFMPPRKIKKNNRTSLKWNGSVALLPAILCSTRRVFSHISLSLSRFLLNQHVGINDSQIFLHHIILILFKQSRNWKRLNNGKILNCVEKRHVVINGNWYTRHS